MNDLYYNKKYLKYKNKYLQLKGGMRQNFYPVWPQERTHDPSRMFGSLSQSNIFGKLGLEPYMRIKISLLNGDEYDIEFNIISDEYTTSELYDKVENIIKKNNFVLYHLEQEISRTGRLVDFGIKNNSELLCIISVSGRFLINPENFINLNNYINNFRILFWERDDTIQFHVELFDNGWQLAFSSNKNITPMLVLLHILQKYFNYQTQHKGLFHTTSIITKELILEAINIYLNDYIGETRVDGFNLISNENIKYIKTDECIEEFYRTFCQPYREDISQDDIISYIEYIKEYPLENIQYEDNDDDDDDDY